VSQAAVGDAVPRRRPVAWFRRLGFRLAVLISVLMLGFDYYSSVISDLVLNMLGEPTPHDTLPDESGWHSRRLLRDAQRESFGSWQPTDSAVERMTSFKADSGAAFVYIDTLDRVVVSSEGLPWAPGTLWTQPLTNRSRVTVPGEASREHRFFTVPLTKDDEPAGRLISLLMNPVKHAESTGVVVDEMFDAGHCRYADDAVILTETEWRALWDRRREIAVMLRVIMPILTALLVAVVVSRLFTHRLRRLSFLASMPPQGDTDLPGPFPAKGKDEIATLARALNLLRSRVSELVGGLEQRDVARREWIAQVSHDLRTPLTALTACLDRADHDLDAGDLKPDAMREFISSARFDADRVATLAEDLLDIARLDADDSLSMEPVPPGEIVRQAHDELRHVADARGVTLQAEVASNLPILMADGRRLMRAMENMVRNAIQFAGSEVIVSASQQNGLLRFEVRDDGPGFPSTDGTVDIDSLAGHLSRADSAGLGLAVTRLVAEAHGGTLGARNLPDSGGAIWIDLPVTPES
jgi:signal transduction histidine kinase